MRGYEYEYYDARNDSLVNAGLVGLGEHLAPTFLGAIDFEQDYQHAWDYRSHGYLHNLEVYSDTYVSIADTYDDLFFQLDGRAQTDSVFIAYIMEGDVLGHTHTREEGNDALLRLARRIEQFRSAHPQRHFRFTLLSDHGFDFTPSLGSQFLDYGAELGKVGITAVDSLGGTDPAQGIFAIPILHARLQYLAIHTHQVADVGLRASQIPSVDFAAGRLGTSDFAIWSGGALNGTFSYASGGYQLEGDFRRFGVPAGTANVSDEALFALTKDGDYPDLFYRVRTAFSGQLTEFPADVLLSNKSGWQSRGSIPPPDPNAIIGAGGHGAAHVDGMGTLLTEERDLPDAARADAFLDLFPHLAAHLRERGIELQPTDPDALRPLR
jgi:hypothetical protein